MRKLQLLSEELRQDAAYAVRTLWHSPAFTLTAIGVLALGIGATLAVLHLFNAAVFHRLSIRDADSLIQSSRICRTKWSRSIATTTRPFPM